METYEALDGTDEGRQEKLLGELGQINSFLLEKLREGHLEPSMKILDNCCGYGHNIRFFIKYGYEAFGTDPSEEAIQLIREYLPGWSRKLKGENFEVAHPSELPFENDSFDFSYSFNFCDFAKNTDQLYVLIKEALRVVRSSSTLLLKLETNIGLEGKILHLSQNRYLMHDGKEKILFSESDLNDVINQLNCKILKPIIVYQAHRMTSHAYISFIKN